MQSPSGFDQEAAAQAQGLRAAATASEPVRRADAAQACQHLQRNVFCSVLLNKWMDELACVGWGLGDSNLEQIV